jgi:hypothetical protein
LISAEEQAVVERLLKVASRDVPSPALLDSVGFLIVRSECECGCDAVFFDQPSRLGQRIAWGYGFISWGCPVELVLWAYDSTISFLEVAPLTGNLARLPAPRSIRPLPRHYGKVHWPCTAPPRRSLIWLPGKP